MPYSQGLSIPLLLGRSQAHAMGNLKTRKQINRLAWLEVGEKDELLKHVLGRMCTLTGA